MAVINKQFVQFAKKATLQKHLDANEILPTSIVFVKETGEIYVNGQYYTNYNQTEANTTAIETIKEQSGWWIEEDTPSFTFGSVESHTKAKADAVVGDICYVGNTPIGVVVIKGDETVKIMSLFDLKGDGTNSPTHIGLTWGASDIETYITNQNDGKANTAELVALGSDYQAAVACSLYSTEGTNQGDWYLPASQELEDMQWSTNNTTIQASLNGLDTLALSLDEDNYYYWSSTESDGYDVCVLNTEYKFIATNHKDGTSNLVRAFCEL